MTVRWTEKAASNLEAIYDYIAEENPAAALNIVSALYIAIEGLVSFPEMGRPAGSDFPKGTRILVRPPYLIFYHLAERAIVVDSVLHGSRRH